MVHLLLSLDPEDQERHQMVLEKAHHDQLHVPYLDLQLHLAGEHGQFPPLQGVVLLLSLILGFPLSTIPVPEHVSPLVLPLISLA